MNRSKWMTLFALVSQIAMTAHAQTNSGNGGDGLMIGGKPYLWDLVEGGLENSTLSRALTGKCRIDQQLNQMLSAQLSEQNLRTAILMKLSDLCLYSEFAAISVAQATSHMVFEWANLALLDIKDEDSLYDVPKENLVQLAARQGVTIFIDQKLWNGLDLLNRTALIFHEVFYALLEPREILLNPKKKIYQQFSPDARRMVRILFSDRLEKLGSSVKDYAFQSINHTKSTLFASSRVGVINLAVVKFNDGSISYSVRDACNTLRYHRSFHDTITGVKFTFNAFTLEPSVKNLDDSKRNFQFYSSLGEKIGSETIDLVDFFNHTSNENCEKDLSDVINKHQTEMANRF